MGASWDDVEVGDKVTWQMTGTVLDAPDFFRRFAVEIDGITKAIDETRSTLVSIERPVVTFKPGDVVRSKSHPELIRTVGRCRYFDHTNVCWYSCTDDLFTSEHYERVED